MDHSKLSSSSYSRRSRESYQKGLHNQISPSQQIAKPTRSISDQPSGASRQRPTRPDGGKSKPPGETPTQKIIHRSAAASKVQSPSGSLQPPQSSSRSPKSSPAKAAPSKVQSPSGSLQPPQSSSRSSNSSPPPPGKPALSFLWRWQLWGVIVVILSGTVGFGATALLLKSSAVPNCPAIFWPTASASMRLYCAELAANKQTIEDLLEAIHLVEDLPSDHPLRAEIDRNIEKWVEDLLVLGEEEFQEGRLEEAVNLANQVAKYLKDQTPIQTKVERWQKVWEEGQRIAAEAESHIKNAAWGQAFQTAAGLTKLNNRYWATTRYSELFDRLELARQESKKLDTAYAALNKGGLESLLEAIALAQEIKPDSLAYAEAQTLMGKAGDQLIELAMTRLKAGDWQTAMEVANRIPNELGLTEQAVDISSLAEAASTASYGTVSNLENAIALVLKISPGRPLYEQAQQLAKQWQMEAEAVAQLDQADQLARDGSVSSLNAAISQARLVSNQNPRYQEAQSKIRSWTRQIAVIEDRPYLDRAQDYASDADVASLQNAVEQARQIEPSRPLYREAQNRIQEWETRIQTNEDQPILDEAVRLASQGDFREAIALARQIGRSRALHGEAETRIQRWEQEIQAQRVLSQAYQTAQRGTPDALNQAINQALQVPSESQYTGQSNQAIQGWSEQILALARNRAGSDLRTAIAIASQVPPNTPAYNAARSQIEIWQRILNPGNSTPNSYLDVQDWGNTL